MPFLEEFQEESSIPKWLHGINSHLGDRRPIDVVLEGRLSEVVRAIEAEKAGAFAQGIISGMMKQVTITELRRRAAEVIGELREGPVLMIQRGQPAAVLITTEDYERMERALAEVDARQVCEIVEAGLNIAWPKTSS